MNLLIVGASGFIGRNLILKAPKDWEIFGTYNTDSTFLSFLEENRLSNVIPCRCNLEDIAEVKQTLDKIENVDVCVYLAANTNVRQLSVDPTLDVSTNLMPLTNFLKYFRGRRLVFFSSGAVYMGLKGQVSPSSKLDPTIPYAISKYASEMYIRAHRNQLETFREYTILRFFGAYGPYEPSRKISTKLVELARNPRGNRFTVFGDGKNYIDFMYIDDAIEGLMRVINSRRTNLTIDFCSGSHLTINQLVKKVGKIFNKEIRVEHKGSSPEYIRFYAWSGSMFQEFGFKPSISWRDGFMRFANWLNKDS